MSPVPTSTDIDTTSATAHAPDLSKIKASAAESVAEAMDIDSAPTTDPALTADDDDVDTASDIPEFDADANADVDADDDPDEPPASFPTNVTKNVTSDGGVTKKILKQGTGYKKPSKNDQVSVTYIGRLVPSGDEFDRSTDPSSPFTFTLGKGQVIKGWDVGVATMKKGERALLTIKPEYGYGESGAGDKIPGGATLEFEVELVGWKDVDALTEDGNVVVKVSEEGSGWQLPKDGWDVIVNYKGTLPDGTVFASAESAIFPVTSTPTDPATPPFFQTAIKKLKKGAKATLTVSPPHVPAVVHTTTALTVPPNTPLTYELELVGWHEVDEYEDGKLWKKILVEGTGWEIPKDGSEVKLNIIGRYISTPGSQPTTFLTADPSESFILSSGSLPDGADLAIEHMKKGEKALVKCPASTFAYGATKNKELGITDAGDLEFEIELVDFTKAKESWDMSHEEKLSDGEKCKEIGNQLFKEGRSRSAIRKYEKAIKYWEYDKNVPSTLKQRVNSVLLSCHLNLALVYSQLSLPAKTITHATKALEMSANNTKALYRRAQAHALRKDWDVAEKDLERAIENGAGGDRAVKALLREVVANRKEEERKSKKVYERMLSGL